MATNRERFAVARENAQKAIDAGNLEEVRKYRAEAETLKELIEAEESMKSLDIPQTEPIRPPLPGVGTGPSPAPVPSDSNEPVSPFVKSFFVHQVGEPEDVEDRILRDLHGADYMLKYWRNRQAFMKYVRWGFDGRSWTRDEVDALKEIILTPNAVKAALYQGFDSVATLKATMVESQDTVGGYVVPVDFQARIIERLRGLTVVRPRADVVATSRDRVEFPKATGGSAGQYRNAVRVTWVDEQPTSTAAETNLTYGMEAIPIYTCMATTPVSKNLLEDAAYPVESHLIGSFADAMAIDEDNRFLTGDGTNAPQGILPDNANGLSLSYGYNPTSTSSIDWDGLINTTFAIDSVYRQNAVWIGEKATYQVIAKLKDSYGQYLWQQQYGDHVTQQPRQRLLMGYEALEQEAMPTVTTNAFPLIFGDLKGYRIADRVGMSVQRYDDSTTAAINQVKFVMRRRLGGKVMETWRFVLHKCATS